MEPKDCNVDCKALVLVMTKTLGRVEGTVDSLVAYIQGNGKPGLSENVRTNARDIAELNEVDAKQKTKAAVWGDRLWKVAVSVGLLIMAISMKG